MDEQSEAENLPVATEGDTRFRGSRADKKAFAKRLGTLIHGRGLRQADVARRAEITPALMSSYVLGKAVPGRLNLIRIATALSVAPDDLLPQPSEDDVIASDAPLSLVVGRTDPSMATLRVNMRVSTTLGSEVVRMLLAEQQKRLAQ